MDSKHFNNIPYSTEGASSMSFQLPEGFFTPKPKEYLCHGEHTNVVKDNLCYWRNGNLICKACGKVVEGRLKGKQLRVWQGIFGTLEGDF